MWPRRDPSDSVRRLFSAERPRATGHLAEKGTHHRTVFTQSAEPAFTPMRAGQDRAIMAATGIATARQRPSSVDEKRLGGRRIEVRTRWLVLVLVLAVLALSACVRPSAAESYAVFEAPREPQSCPVATEGTQLLRNEAHGYCLLYPDGYQAQYPNESQVVLFVGSLMNHQQPRASIAVEEAAGRSAAQVADELAASFAGFDVKRSSTTIGDQEAFVLDNLPGQDTNRQVVLVHGGRLYRLMFTPLGADYGEVGAQTGVLYATVVESLRFLPQE
jgi:hypothetical protein